MIGKPIAVNLSTVITSLLHTLYVDIVVRNARVLRFSFLIRRGGRGLLSVNAFSSLHVVTSWIT